MQFIALLTQEGGYEHGAKPGRATVANVNHALKALHKWAIAEKPASIAIPRLSTGVGGLDWKDVLPLIIQHLGHLPCPVFLYTTYHKGVAAKEMGEAATA